MNKIVVLDGYTLNPGDLSWHPLEQLGQLTVHLRLSPEEVVEEAADATIVLTNKCAVTRAMIADLPALRYIGVLATGFNVVDAAAARERGIPVTNVPGYSTPSVAQTVFALLLELTNHVGKHSDLVREGEWSSCPDFCFTRTPIMELSGKTFGIIGLGDIGLSVAKIASAFGMRVLAVSRTPKQVEGVEFVKDLFQLAEAADVISLHCPLTPSTEGIINASFLTQMKPSAFLINTGRGQLINEHDLLNALRCGRIAGAGLDVLSTEPPASDHPLLRAPNAIITPHYAWASKEARQRLLSKAAANVAAFLAGTPSNVVN